MESLFLSQLTKPFIISGPCVLENSDIPMKIADFLSNMAQKYNLDIIYKASFDKANRSSSKSFRGVGLKKGLETLNEIRIKNSLLVTTDVHETYQVEQIANDIDILQIPAFLCRQTDLITECAKTGKVLNVKKGQFLSPYETKNIAEKIRSVSESDFIFTERGTTFGYNNLVVDFRSIPVMKRYAPFVCFDATHSVQKPGGLGDQSTGDREFVTSLAKAALALNVDCLFFEIHPEPEKALSDGPNSLDFTEFESILKYISGIREFLYGKEQS